MDMDSVSRESLWKATSQPPTFEALNDDLIADVCVVGAGIAGLSIAYELAQRGANVVVLERNEVGAGVTAQTTAHLASALDDRYYELERMHGAGGAQLAAQSHAAAIDRIAAVVEREGIECGFERLPGYLIGAPGRPDDELSRECDAARRAGLECELLERFTTGFGPAQPALRFERQAQMHPLHYVHGLARACDRARVRVRTHTKALDFHGGRKACVGSENGRRVDCGAIVVATNTPVNDRFAMHTKQAPYRSFVIALTADEQAFGRCLLWDTGDPYHYARTWRDAADPDGSQWLIVGGEDHKTGQDEVADERFARLHAWCRDRLGIDAPVRHAWTGQVLEPVDSLAFIGRNPHDDDNVYIVTGDSGNGITHGALSGLLIADLIQGNASPWEDLYAPARVRARATGEFVRENANVAAQYRDFVTPAEVGSVDGIGRDDGAVVRRGLHRIAVYRDAQGNLHGRTAVCPHLGCVVRWNAVEKTWDCPCHGSRFDPRNGRPINGPAIVGLDAVELDAKKRA